MKKWGARYTFCKGDQQCSDSRHKYDGDQSYWLLAVVAIAKVIKIPVNEPVGIRQQYPWGWEFTFHTVLQCFCNLYYSTCFWVKWFARMKCYGQQVIFLTFSDEWWWGDVKESLKRSSYNTRCTIFYHSSIYIAIQNIQNVEYSTIPKYTKYTKYTKYSTIVLYTLQYLHVPWFLQPYWTKSSLSALISGVQTCTILLHCKCWEPWQAKSSRSTFQWDWKIESLGRTLPRGVQIMLCLVPPKSWWGGGYIQNIYRIYTKCICLWSFFCIVTSNTSPLMFLRFWSDWEKTEFRIKNWV